MTDTTTTPRSVRKRVLVLLAVGVVVVAAVVAWRVLGQERTVPYEDPQSAGLITLCSADGKAVTEGSVKDTPFADLTVGETGLPSEIDPEGTVATLFAYQPRQGIAAGEFSAKYTPGSSTQAATSAMMATKASISIPP